MDRCEEPLDGAPGGRRRLWDHRQSLRIKTSCVFSILACVGSLLEKINHNSSMQHLCSHHGKGRKPAFQAKMHSISPGKKPPTLYTFNCKLWVNVLIHSEHEADGNKPHACGLSHFFHICILETTFGARGLTSVSITSVYELNGHMSSCWVGKCVQGIRR